MIHGAHNIMARSASRLAAVLIRSPLRSQPTRTRVYHLSSSMEDRTVQSVIEFKLKDTLKPTHLQVINESYMHNVPRGSETHFKVVVVSEEFQDMPLIKRHRLVMNTLKTEMDGGVHALSIQAKTPQQWEVSGGKVTESPPCLGGSKR